MRYCISFQASYKWWIVDDLTNFQFLEGACQLRWANQNCSRLIAKQNNSRQLSYSLQLESRQL